MTYRVYIDLPPRRLASGLRYTVHLGCGAGEVIVTDSKEPLLDASRVLMARGMTGKLELWDSERPFPRLTGDIAKLAGQTVRETETKSPRFASWKPFPVTPYEAGAAKSGSKVGRAPRTEAAAGERVHTW